MSAAPPSHEIDAERETPTPALVLVRTQDEPRAAGSPSRADDASLSELWRIHGTVLRRFALKLTLGDNYRAEDLVQEARLRAWRHLEYQLTDGPSLVEPIDQAVTAMDVRAALAQLRPEHRQVIVWMFYLGRSVTEIAQLLSIPEGTVKWRSYYGLRQLKRLLSAASGEH